MAQPVLSKNSLITIGSALAIFGAVWREAQGLSDKINVISANQIASSTQVAAIKELMTFQLKGTDAAVQSYREDTNNRMNEMAARDETFDARLRALETTMQIHNK